MTDRGVLCFARPVNHRIDRKSVSGETSGATVSARVGDGRHGTVGSGINLTAKYNAGCRTKSFQVVMRANEEAESMLDEDELLNSDVRSKFKCDWRNAPIHSWVGLMMFSASAVLAIFFQDMGSMAGSIVFVFLMAGMLLFIEGFSTVIKKCSTDSRSGNKEG